MKVLVLICTGCGEEMEVPHNEINSSDSRECSFCGTNCHFDSMQVDREEETNDPEDSEDDINELDFD